MAILESHPTPGIASMYWGKMVAAVRASLSLYLFSRRREKGMISRALFHYCLFAPTKGLGYSMSDLLLHQERNHA